MSKPLYTWEGENEGEEKVRVNEQRRNPGRIWARCRSYCGFNTIFKNHYVLNRLFFRPNRQDDSKGSCWSCWCGRCSAHVGPTENSVLDLFWICRVDLANLARNKEALTNSTIQGITE
jgi:hypothetical protein